MKLALGIVTVLATWRPRETANPVTRISATAVALTMQIFTVHWYYPQYVILTYLMRCRSHHPRRSEPPLDPRTGSTRWDTGATARDVYIRDAR